MVSRVSSSLISVPLRPARVLLVALVAASVLLTGCLLAPEKTRAARGMELALQDDATFLVGGKRVPRERAFTYARQLGVTRLRVNLLWAYTMNRGRVQRSPQAGQDPVPVRLGRLAGRPGCRPRHPRAPLADRPGAALGAAEVLDSPGLVQAEHARVRQVGRGRGRALRRTRRPLQHLERAQLEDLARAAQERAGALPQPVHARLHGDQGRRPAREGADRRDEPDRARRAVDRAAGVPAQGGLRQQQVQARGRTARS